jgi:hypothetical protein
MRNVYKHLIEKPEEVLGLNERAILKWISANF